MIIYHIITSKISNTFQDMDLTFQNSPLQKKLFQTYHKFKGERELLIKGRRKGK